MTRDEITSNLNKVFQDVFDDDDLQVGDSTTAADVAGWDSLNHITLIANVESEFGIKFSMKEIISMKNVGEMIDIIEREMA
jgi:acyl carrier protein